MFKDPGLESDLRRAISMDEPEKLLARFATLTGPAEAGLYVRRSARSRCRHPLAAAVVCIVDKRRGGRRRRVLRAGQVRRRHRRSLRHAAGGCSGAGVGSGGRQDRAHRGLLNARHRACVRAARRRGANLHPSRRRHSRRHLHADLGSADTGIARPQAANGGCVRERG